MANSTQVANKYPELPTVPYKKTSTSMSDVVAYIAKLPISIAVKVAVYTVFCNESANGAKGVNENYAGIQADNSRWPDNISKLAIATTVIAENMTGKQRRFLVFNDFKASVDFLSDRSQSRGLYVGGTPHLYYFDKISDRNEWVLAYWREWVMGAKTSNPPADEKSYLLKIYARGIQLFN